MLVLGGRVFSVESNHWHGVGVNGTARTCFVARGDFAVGYLRNDAMHAFGKYRY